LIMTKRLLACCFFIFLLSCKFTFKKSGQLFVNQQLIETSIQSVQPVEQIELSVQTTNNHDSVLIVSLTVDPKIPDDSLDASKAKMVLGSFITILPAQDLKSFTNCKIVFIKKEGTVISKSRSIAYTCPMTPDLVSRVNNYKDSARTTVGYIDPHWNYINQDLNLLLPLKPGWLYASKENDSIVYYDIGSDINQLPQYRTDTDRRVTYLTLRNLDPGGAYPVLQLNKNKELLTRADGKTEFLGPTIMAGLVLNPFLSEDEYINALFELFFKKKLSYAEIHSYSFGNASFRGHQFIQNDKNGKMINYLSVIRRFGKVSLVMNLKYSNNKELEEIKNELSGLQINQ
jgi:hypothetical protein